MIPSLDEIKAAPLNGLRALSTFSGCGGSSTGLRWAGFDIVAAAEFVGIAADTYAANYPSTPVLRRDLRGVSGVEWLTDLGLAPGDVDLLEGSPPCSAFSVAGRGSAKWGKVVSYSDTEQRVDDLFYVFVRLVDEIRPRAFLAENVPGLIAGKSKGQFKRIVAAFEQVGFTVRTAVLDASYLGVPQQRRRLYFVGFSDPAAAARFEFPKPEPQTTISDGLPWLRSIRTRGSTTRRSAHLRAANTITSFPSAVGGFTFSGVDGDEKPPGWDSLPDEERGDFRRSPRLLSIPELRRVCGFPDDYTLLGSWRQRWERLGRSVCPPVYLRMGRQIAEALR